MANEIEEKLDEEDKGYYSYILKNKRQQYGLAIVLIVTYVIFAFVIAQNLVIKKDWGGAMLPLFMFGLPLILYPRTETWVYKPWQSLPRKYERTRFD